MDPRLLAEWGFGQNLSGYTIPMAGRFDQAIPRDPEKIRAEEEGRRRRQARFRELVREWVHPRPD